VRKFKSVTATLLGTLILPIPLSRTADNLLIRTGQYSGQYSGQVSQQYSGQYSGRYSGQYSGQFTGQPANANSVVPLGTTGQGQDIFAPPVNTGACGELYAPTYSDPFPHDSSGRQC
jgi:hypothetical protein